MENLTKKVFCVFLLAVSVVTVPESYFTRRFYPPVIQPSYDETVVNSTGNLTLTCTGSESVRWSYPNNTHYWSNINVSVSDRPNAEGVYKAILTLTNASYDDVGFYYCHGETSDKTNPRRSSKIYVYVRDENQLSVPSQEPVLFFEVQQYSNITIPCLPTSPDVHVTLINSNEDEVPREEAPFDPRYGFTLNVSFDEQSYDCKFTRDDLEDTKPVYLHVRTKTETVSMPRISAPNNGRVAVGDKLVLNCTVTVELNVYFGLQWRVPSQSGFKSGRITYTNATSESTRNGEKFGTSYLTIKEVISEDAGEYKCIVIDHSNNTNHAVRYITVYEQGDSIIDLTYHEDVTNLTEIAGKDSIQWVINVDSYPIATLTWFNNLNEEIDVNTKNNKYFIKTSDKDTMLKINHIELGDSGMYQLRAMNGVEEKTLNLTLTVFDKPTVHVQSENYHKYGEESQLKCSAAGFPLPNVFWSYKPCQNDKCSFQRIPTSNYTTINQGLSTVSYVNITAYESGYIMCYANNSQGNDSNTIGFFVTDINNGLDIWGPEYGSVAVGDTIKLHCAASVYNYTNKINFYFDNGTDSPLLITSNDKFQIEKTTTNFSYFVTMTIKSVTHNETGEYTCKVTPQLPEDDHFLTLSIHVQDPEKPRIIKSNMNNTEKKITLGSPITFFCDAVGIPTPTITWTKDNHDWSVGTNYSRVKLLDENRRLSFLFTQQEDEGTYTCRATNRVGSIERKMQLTLSSKSTLSTTLLSIIILLGILFVIMVTILVVKIKKEKKLRKELRVAGLMNFEKGALESLNPELGVDDQAELLPYDKKWEFPRDKLKLGKQLGSGAFGVVMKAEAFGITEGETISTVAVKMVKKNADYTYIKALASELKIMVHLGKHLNVVNLLGACTKNVTKRELFVIVEYCRFGNLHNYLLRHREDFINQIDPKTGNIDPSIGTDILSRTMSVGSNQSSGPPSMACGGVDYRASPNVSSCATDSTMVTCSPTGEDTLILSNNSSIQPEWRSNYRGDYKGNVRPISTHDLLCWAFQVARGMEYLASRKVLHGDLAARNILLAEDNIVKICDFGLAKSMYKSDNYKKKGDGPLPVKWMAVESIRDRVFSTQSDVWSYGIVLWEFFSLARTPYPGMDADERLYNKLVDGYRMDQPEYATKEIYQTMQDCWHAKPTYRPSFTTLAESLGCMLQETVRKHYIDLNNPYIIMNNERLCDGHSDYLAMLSPPDYGNLASPHNYVNDIIPFTEQAAETSGYVCMKPSDIFSPTREKEDTAFNFELHKKQKNNGELATGIELIPMLGQVSESDSELSPTSPTKSFMNPNYKSPQELNAVVEPQKEDLIKTADNYINMPQQKNAIKSFSNPTYVQMINKDVNDDEKKNYVNSQSRDWEKPYV